MFNMVVYEKNNGKTTALDFMEELPAKYRSKIFKKLELLKEQGNNLGEPHVKPIEGKLWELRIQYKTDQVRMIYFIDEKQTIVLLHGFVKKDQKIRRSEIETAQKRLKEYIIFSIKRETRGSKIKINGFGDEKGERSSPLA